MFLTGDGALIRGIDGLFKIQLNIQTKIMDSLYNVKFDPKIDLKIYNPVYLISPIGAAFAPMGFRPTEVKSRAGSNTEYAKYCAIAMGVMIAASAVAIGVTTIWENNTTQKRDNLQSQIAAIEDIDQIITDYDAAKAKYDDIETMYDQTRTLNENVRMFIDALEENIPKNAAVTSFSTNEESVNLACTASKYDDIAKLVIQMKKIDCIEDAFVTDITTEADDETGEETYNFNVTCKFVSMVEKESLGVEDDSSNADATLEEVQQ